MQERFAQTPSTCPTMLARMFLLAAAALLLVAPSTAVGLNFPWHRQAADVEAYQRCLDGYTQYEIFTDVWCCRSAGTLTTTPAANDTAAGETTGGGRRRAQAVTPSAASTCKPTESGFDYAAHGKETCREG